MAKNITKIRHRLPFVGKFKSLIASLVKHKPVFVLIILSCVIAFLNYQPGTILSGWDNLHPEFDITLNLKRSLNSVWQEYQGNGLVGGMAHAADLPRQLIIWGLLSLNIPVDLIRYLTTFFCLTLGPVGAYFLIRRLIARYFAISVTKLASFIGALFYLLNLATVQTFYTPFDSFTWFYGFLPLVVLSTIRYLDQPHKRNRATLLLVLLLSSPAYYVQTIFVSLIIYLFPFFVSYVITETSLKNVIRSSLSIIMIFLVANAHWLFPAGYYVLTHRDLTATSQINQLATPEIQDRNLRYANIFDIFELKGFWLSYLDLGQDNTYQYLMQTWRDHLDSPIIKTISIVIAFIIFAGLFFSFRKKITHYRSLLISLLTVSLILLGGNLLIGQNIPIFGEIFRSPFTKFAVPLSLMFSIYFALGFLFIYDLFAHYLNDTTSKLASFSTAILLLAYTSPIFSGQLISPQMRTKMPTNYFELFNKLNTLPPGKIANLPQYNLWGWTNYRWGYRGSGFLWYGISQPIMDRAFDVWQPSNEQYYEHLQEAIFSADSQLLSRVLDHYQVSYILLDKSVFSPQTADNHQVISRMLEDLALSPIFESGDLSLYELHAPNTSPIISTQRAPNINLFDYNGRDVNLITQSDKIEITRHVDLKTTQTLEIPDYYSTESLTPYLVSYQKLDNSLKLTFDPLLPQLEIDSQITNLSPSSFSHTFILESNTDNFFLGLNNQYLEIQSPTELSSIETAYPIGHFYLHNNAPNTLRLFSSTPIFKRDLYEQFTHTQASLCTEISPHKKVEKIVTPESISLLTQNSVGCLSTSIPVSLTGLHIFSFQYASSTSTPVNATITTQNASQLFLQNDPLKSSATFLPARIYTYTSQYNPTISFIIEANDTNTIQEASLKHPIYQVHPLLSEVTLELPSTSSQSLSLTPGKHQFKLTIPKITPFNNQLIDPKNNLLSTTARNCDPQNSVFYDKTVSLTGFTYKSIQSNSCDYQNLRNLPHQLGYLFEFNYSHQTGNEPIICLENYLTKRCDLYTRLKANSTNRFISTITDSSEGYTLHWYNPSHSHQPTQNTLHSVELYPLPIKFMRHIYLTNESESITLNFEHPQETWYSLTTQQTNVPIYLYQTYSPHWLAFALTTSPKLGIQLVQSTPEDWFQAFSLDKSINWHIVFWPQLLGLLGLGVSTISLIFSLTQLRRIRKINKH